MKYHYTPTKMANFVCLFVFGVSCGIKWLKLKRLTDNSKCWQDVELQLSDIANGKGKLARPLWKLFGSKY